MLARTGDPGLQKAAESMLSRSLLVVPDLLREYLHATPVYVSKGGAPVSARRDLPTMIRHAMRRQPQDDRLPGRAGRHTERVIRPFAVASHVEATLVCAWCELKQRHPALSNRPHRRRGRTL
jgi:predicted DNA-binding transcriptional regulator YafY